ncbi:hypothetical protein HID58_057716 [Brassica napus]|uniref:Uncharacterized protein n=1 Tax=Brassica napus TaxID=3708 RepID=A0ABQ7XFN1_BRANA|nr:hypothetical protein HID58_057716 [Brassica napus]
MLFQVGEIKFHFEHPEVRSCRCCICDEGS